ncbi:Copia protein [Anthophora plagiata]
MENSKTRRNIKQFDGSRYSVWKLRIHALLNELGVIQVINETAPERMTEDWRKAERIAKGTIIEYLSDSFLGFAKTEHTASEILKKLDSIYERKSLATQLAIRKKLLGLKLESDQSLIKHFTVFDDLMTELSAAGAKLDESDKVSHLLLTLPTSYDGVITAIETLSEENLTVGFVKTRLLDHEVKLNTENETSAKVLHVQCSNKSGAKLYKNRNNIKYNNQKGPYNRKKTVPQIKCHQCGRKGHMKRECYFFKRSLQYAEKKKATAQATQVMAEVEMENPGETTTSFAFMTGEYQQKGKDNKLNFLLDSGASEHITNRENVFSSFEEIKPPMKISIAKEGAFILATKRGTIEVTSDLGIKGALRDVLYCPEVPHNLLSVRRMQEAGMNVIFNNTGEVKVTKNGQVIMKGKKRNNLSTIDFQVINGETLNNHQIHSVINNDYELWHQRLGHIGKSKFLELKNKQMVDDVNRIETVVPNDSLCEACIKGKQARLSFEKAKNKDHIKRPLFIVHSDVCGPITPSTINGKNYFVLFVDEYTHYCVTYLVTHKSQVFSIFKDFVTRSEAHFNLKVVHLYIDNGREYLSNEMKDYCVEKGISYHLTVPRTPQLNGVSERMVRTITEKARTMISGASLSKMFWGEAVLTATYLINLTPTKALKQCKTPFEMWHDKKPKVRYLRIFGSTVYIHDKTRKDKFDEKSWKGILVGYEPNGYRVWDSENEKFVTVRDVIVDEMTYLTSRPVMRLEGIDSKDSHNETDGSNVWSKSVGQSNKSDISKSDVQMSHKSDNDESDVAGSSVKVRSKRKLVEETNKSVVETDNKRKSSSHNKSSNEIQETPEPRRSDRIKQLAPMSYDENCMGNDCLMTAQYFVYRIPNSFDEIETRDDRVKWQQAINEEINSLLVNKTWTLVQRPEKRNIVDCRWVFTIKNNEFGDPVKYKARLVARGFSQQYLIDYNETFAPVARITSFRFIIAFANQNNLLLHHMDVKTAFLNGELKEEIYMKVPQGIESKIDQVCKLNKALYGLKQAARCWYEVFDKSLKDKGFKNSAVDRCIYILENGNILKNIYVVLYVDDLVIATANSETMESFKNYLMNKFHMTDLKEIKYFLGIKVERDNNKITLDQSAYIQTVLEKFNMQDCKPISTPLPSKLDYIALNSDEKFEAPCRNLIGCLMYVMVCTRPDLCTAVNILSRYTNKNNKELWQELKRVLRYLKGSKDIKLTYTRGQYNNLLIGYADSDWGGSDTNDRKSTSGYLFQLFEKCTICWSTKRQASVAASSTDAEYMALFEAVKEALWLKSLAISINIRIEQPIVTYEDNNGCISIANNPSSHKRSKHIDIKYHFTREQVERKVIQLIFISTENQLADILTKPLPAVKFLKCRAEMGLTE